MAIAFTIYYAEIVATADIGDRIYVISKQKSTKEKL